jgi:hypothetical protein
VKPPKIESVVFCEDARNEINGKQTLLGVSAPEITAHQIPADIRTAIWISMQPLDLGPFEGEFRVTNKNREIVKAKLQFTFQNKAKASLVIGPFPLHVSETGEYWFEWNLDGRKWVRLGSLKVNDVGTAPVPTPASGAASVPLRSL